MVASTPIKHDTLQAKAFAEKIEYASTEETAAPAPIDDSIEETKIGPFIWLVALTASVAGALFGYDTGIISAVLVYMGSSLGHELPANEKELVTSLCSAGAFCGAIVAGLTADRYGRKAAIYAK